MAWNIQIFNFDFNNVNCQIGCDKQYKEKRLNQYLIVSEIISKWQEKVYCFLWFFLNHLQCILAKTKYATDNYTLKLFQSPYTIFQWFFYTQYSPKCMQICKRFSWMRYIMCKYLHPLIQCIYGYTTDPFYRIDILLNTQ